MNFNNREKGIIETGKNKEIYSEKKEREVF